MAIPKDFQSESKQSFNRIKQAVKTLRQAVEDARSDRGASADLIEAEELISYYEADPGSVSEAEVADATKQVRSLIAA